MSAPILPPPRLPRGLTHLLPTAAAQATPAERAAAQLQMLRTATVPVAVLAAALELLAPLLGDADPATRAAADDVRTRLLATIEASAPAQ
ncbi:hypothetical protein ACWEO1_36180 [Kitasatospora cineracea]